MKKYTISIALLASACGEAGTITNQQPSPTPTPSPSMSPSPSPTMSPSPSPSELPKRQAWIYRSDPVSDDGRLTQVTLPETATSADGHLRNASVAVTNCLNEDGGPTSTRGFGGFNVTIQFCHEVATVAPDATGNYLGVLPPADDKDPNDPFAEVSMYYHVNYIHDYFHERQGLRSLDYPLPALVNVEFKIDPPIGMTGPDGWSPFANAAFFPKESWNQLAGQLGLPLRDQDAIIFGQADADFSYDSRVIYHEYTHAMIGKDRLNARVADQYGVNDLAGAMNEGLADYFSATQGEDPAIGKYGIGKISPTQIRDLSHAKKCPDDLVGEVHADGKVIASAAWQIRSVLGSTVTDGIIYRAVQQFTASTSLEAAGALILSEATLVGTDAEAAARTALDAHGMLSCVRAKPWVTWSAQTSEEGLAYPVEGTQSVGVPGFTSWAPAPFGFYVDVPADATSLKLSWGMTTGGGFGGFGGGGGMPKLALALRRGSPVTIDLSQATPTRTEDKLLRPNVANNAQAVTLAASCLPPGGGRLYLMLVNEGTSQVSVSTMGLAQNPAPEAGVVPEECP
ncbi:MAG: hypothetical protein U1E65_04810 [Myxococcota bacterium]